MLTNEISIPRSFNPFICEAYLEIGEENDIPVSFTLTIDANATVENIVRVENLATLEEYQSVPFEVNEDGYNKIFTTLTSGKPSTKKTNTRTAILHEDDNLNIVMSYNLISSVVTLKIVIATDTLGQIGKALKRAEEMLDYLAMCVSTRTLLEEIRVGAYQAYAKHMKSSKTVEEIV